MNVDRRFLSLAVSTLLCAGVACASCSQPSQNAASPATSAGPSNVSSLLYKQPANDHDPVVAEVGPVKIYASELDEKFMRMDPAMRQRFNSLQRKKDYLDNLVRQELLAVAAVQAGYDRHPEVVRAAKQMMVQKLKQQQVEEPITAASITDAEVEQYYTEHARLYAASDTRRASHILVKPADPSSEASWKEAAAKAAGLYKQVVAAARANPASFEDIARKTSEDPVTARMGGDLGYFAKDDPSARMDPVVTAAVFGMKNINDVSLPVKGRAGYHILRFTGADKKPARSIEEERNAIRDRLLRQKKAKAFQDYINDLKTKYNVVVNEQALGKVGPAESAPAEGQPLTPPSPTPPGPKAAPAPAEGD